jgi:sugar phosphate isomerase/epimerase
MVTTGLNPYGLTYLLGLQGAGSERANPSPGGWPAFLEVADELQVQSIELHALWFRDFGAAEFAALRDRLVLRGLRVVISLGPPLAEVELAIRAARELGARAIRLGLTPVLCGDRAAHGAAWPAMLAHARETLGRMAPVAAEHGISFAIENHQDLGSSELMELSEEAGPNVGITLDTGNPLAVGEGILAFTEVVAPRVLHVHWKDYQVQWTAEGYRLVRCAIGDGCVPFAAIHELLEGQGRELTGSLEPAALEARHVRLFLTEWWRGYPDRQARELGPCLADARRSLIAEESDYRTPWERGAAPGEIVDYELAMIRRSAGNLRRLGLM